MKDDIGPAPETVPRKRKVLESAPDVWLHQWLGRAFLTPSERRKVQEVLDARKAARGREERRVGIIVGREGMTPQQVLTFSELVGKVGATEFHHVWHPFKPLHTICVRSGVPTVVHGEGRSALEHAGEVVKVSDLVIAAVKEYSEPLHKREGAWEMVKYAKHRRTAVMILKPDGSVQ